MMYHHFPFQLLIKFSKVIFLTIKTITVRVEQKNRNELKWSDQEMDKSVEQKIQRAIWLANAKHTFFFLELDGNRKKYYALYMCPGRWLQITVFFDQGI
jgi:hypothetical protein